MDSTTPKRTITHKLNKINNIIEQQVPTEESKLHLMHEFLKSSIGKEVLAYHTQQLQLQIPNITLPSMYLCVYIVV